MSVSVYDELAERLYGFSGPGGVSWNVRCAGAVATRMGKPAAMTEIEMIEQAYFDIIKERFKVFVLDTDSQSLYSHGALNRLIVQIKHARAARDEAIAALKGLKDEKYI